MSKPNQECRAQGYCFCKTYNCLTTYIKELEAQLAEIAELTDKLLNSIGDRASVKTAICIAHEIDIILNREKAE